jgi:hypothetical protein
MIVSASAQSAHVISARVIKAHAPFTPYELDKIIEGPTQISQ